MLPDTGTPPGLTAPSHGRTLYFHYAWVIVAMISVVQIVGGSIYAAFGVFIGPMTDTFGWSQGKITLAYALSSLVTALVAPLAGSFGDRYGARRAMALGSALFVIGMALMGLISEPWHFYLTFGVIMGVAHSIFMVPLLAVTMDWFRRHLGLGMGVLMSAKGIGPVGCGPPYRLSDHQLWMAGHLLDTSGRLGRHPGRDDHLVPQPPRRQGRPALRRDAGRPH